MGNPATDIDLHGTVVAERYRVVARLGRGGMGAVYAAEDVRTGARYAIKTLLEDMRDAEMLGRFQREASAGSFLHHPNVVQCVAFGQLPGGPTYLVMELVEGRTIGELLGEGALAPRRALVLARQALEGIGHAHHHGMVHRDIKPENLMVTVQGAPGACWEVVKILDFGLVKLLGDVARLLGDDKLTRTGAVFGTPAYLSPEQALGRPIDGRVDLYAMGVVLFEMLAGKRPFDADDPMTLLRMHVGKPPPRLADVAPGPWCTPDMEQLIAGALRKRPDERFGSAREMIDALDAAFLSIDHLPA